MKNTTYNQQQVCESCKDWEVEYTAIIEPKLDALMECYILLMKLGVEIDALPTPYADSSSILDDLVEYLLVKQLGHIPNHTKDTSLEQVIDYYNKETKRKRSKANRKTDETSYDKEKRDIMERLTGGL